MNAAPSEREQRVFAAIADPQRRAMIGMLADESMPVRELAARFDISRPGVSKHLRVLREAGLVREQKVGRQRLYEVNREPLLAVADWLTTLWSDRLNALQELVLQMEDDL